MKFDLSVLTEEELEVIKKFVDIQLSEREMLRKAWESITEQTPEEEH